MNEIRISKDNEVEAVLAFMPDCPLSLIKEEIKLLLKMLDK